MQRSGEWDYRIQASWPQGMLTDKYLHGQIQQDSPCGEIQGFLHAADLTENRPEHDQNV